MVVKQIPGIRFLRSLVRRCKYHPLQKPVISLTDQSLGLVEYGFSEKYEADSKSYCFTHN